MVSLCWYTAKKISGRDKGKILSLQSSFERAIMSDREFINRSSLDWRGRGQAINSYMQEDGFLTEFKNTKKFEDSIAEFTGSKHCIVVNNGTISLTLAALALDIKPGDEVLVPNFTMVATPNSIKMIGQNLFLSMLRLRPCVSI